MPPQICNSLRFTLHTRWDHMIQWATILGCYHPSSMVVNLIQWHTHLQWVVVGISLMMLVLVYILAGSWHGNVTFPAIFCSCASSLYRSTSAAFCGFFTPSPSVWRTPTSSNPTIDASSNYTWWDYSWWVWKWDDLFDNSKLYKYSVNLTLYHPTILKIIFRYA